jgi:hypothetical protein
VEKAFKACFNSPRSAHEPRPEPDPRTRSTPPLELPTMPKIRTVLPGPGFTLARHRQLGPELIHMRNWLGNPHASLHLLPLKG